MMSFNSLYQQKRMKAADALRQVNNGDIIIVPTGVGEPPTLLNALSEQRRDFRDVQGRANPACAKYGYIDPDTAEHVRHVAFFFGGASRAGGQEGWIDFIPNYFSEMPRLIERGVIPADVVFSHGLADGRARLLLAEPGRRLHHGRDRARPARWCWKSIPTCPSLTATAMCTSRR